MNGIILTQNSTPIFKYIVWVLGKIMEGIFFVIEKIGIPNIGLAIILFTILVNLLMLPLTIKQQKFAKLNAKLNPEIEVIRNKYKGRTDNESSIAMNGEIQAVYAKYGVSPTGTCGYLLIQMPILFALYRVIYSMPAYVRTIGNTFRVLADKIVSGGLEFFLNSGSETINRNISMYGKTLSSYAEKNLNTISDSELTTVTNSVIDVLNKLSTSDMKLISDHYGLAGLTYPETGGQLILSNDTTKGLIDIYNNFLGLNIGNSPWYVLKEAVSAGAWLVALGAVIIPVLSCITQWINTKLMPQQNSSSGDEQAQAMASSMKTMNLIMPLFSMYICFTLPSGVGLYWVAGSIVRSIQQIVINKQIDKMDFDEIIKKNSAKSQKMIEKQKAQQEKLYAYAAMNTKNIKSGSTNSSGKTSSISSNNKGNDLSNLSSPVSNSAAKPGSMREKANLVKKYNEQNNK